MPKFCTRCGAQNKDEVQYCDSCGMYFSNPKPETVNPAGANTPYNQNVNSQSFQNQNFHGVPQYQNTYPAQNVYPAQNPVQNNYNYSGNSGNPVISAVKAAASDQKFLIFIILFSAMVIVNLIYLIINFIQPIDVTYVNDIINDYNGYNLYIYSSEFIDIIASVSVIFSLIPFISNLLICLGLWIFRISAKSSSNSVSTGGFSLINIGMIIRTIYIVLIPLLINIVLFQLINEIDFSDYSNYSNSPYTQDATSSALIVGIIVVDVIIACIVALPIIYNIFAMRTSSSIKKSIKTSTPAFKISGFVIVMNYIFVGLNALSLIFTLVAFAISPVMTTSIFSIASSVLNSIVLIMLSLQMSSFKQSTNMLKFNQNQGVPQYYYPNNFR